MHPAPFVWIDDAGPRRMSHAYFRREFSLDAPAETAKLHLFADTNYHLWVNEEFVGYGPLRGYPEFPEYDTYDLAPLLRPGANVVAVHVLHVGLPTFHNLPGRGGLACWGTVTGRDGTTVSLSTEGDWVARKAEGYDQTTPLFSFAQPPTQTFDERREPPGWNTIERPEGNWPAAVLVAEQDAWGPLRPRSIPPLTQDTVLPLLLRGAWRHSRDEQILSFRVSQEPVPGQGHFPAARAFACSYIHSPHAQKVTVGTYWGEHFLNGQPLPQEPERPDQMLRTDTVFDLQPGWNFFFVSYGMVQGIWEMHLAVPRSAGLIFAADRKQDSDVPFWTTAPFPAEEADAILKQSPPDAPESLPALAGRWQPQPSRNMAVSPQRGLSWARFEGRLDVPASQVQNIVIPAGQPASLVFDMGREVLGRVVVEFDAPRDTHIDIGIAELMRCDRPDYSRMPLITAAERQIARGGPSRLETFFPRGFRFLQVAIEGHNAPVTIRKAGAVSQVYPYTQIGRFECSDPFFETLWQYGWNTLQLCSEDVYTDCPWRERTLYAGDLLPEAATALATTGDGRLVRRCLDIFLQSQSPESGWLQGMAPIARHNASLSDYPLIALVITDWYCRYTGDRAFAEQSVPVFRRMMAALQSRRDPQGLFTTDGDVFLDWIQMTHSGPICALNGLIIRTLEAWASLLDMTGNSGEASEARTLRQETAEAVSRCFWDEERGAFADTLQDGQREDSFFVLSSAWPMLAALTLPEQDRRSVLHFRQALAGFDGARDGEFTSPYGGFYLLGALYDKGEAGFAEDCIRHLWADMIEYPTGTVWENFNQRNSLVHAWSSAPTYYLSTRALGVRLGFPDRTDLNQVFIAPMSETLDWARGVVSHPLGPISVDWAIRGSRLLLNYHAPEGVAVTVAPAGRLANLALWVNGRPRR